MRNADSIKASLRRLAQQEARSFDYLLKHYLIERFLYRLSISDYSENFILKGGLLLYVLLDNDARATKDVDFLARRLGNTFGNRMNAIWFSPGGTFVLEVASFS